MNKRQTNQLAMRAEAQSPDFRIACVETAGQAIGTLEPGCRILGLTKGQFSMLDLIRAVLAQTGPANLVISTWTTGIRDMENAAWLIQRGEILDLRLLTDRSFPGRQPQYCARLRELFGDDAVRATRTHAKFAIVRNDRWDICIRASMNLNRNQRWENFDLDDSAEICDFFEKLVSEMESLTPRGPQPGEKAVEEAFQLALAAETSGDTTVVPEEQRLARLGYTRAEIRRRLGDGADGFTLGHHQLEDQLREATISAALGGDAKARAKVGHWISQQQLG
jgi:hypothetical protein